MKFERLGEKITQVRGISYKPNEISAIPTPDYVPILKANNIQEDGIDTSDLIYIHKSKVKPEQFIRKGDLLLAASSGSKEIVGKNIYFESDFDGSFGAFCKLVRPKKNINPRYLATFFKSVSYKRHIKKLLSGALINNLKNEYIDSLLIPELSDSDQHHIANILSKAENLIAQRKESIRLLDEFLKSTFLEMFGDPVRNEKGWKKVACNSLFDMKLGKMLSAKNYTGESLMPYLRNVNVKWGEIDLTDIKEMDFSEKEKELYSLKAGDILVCEGGEVGKTAILKSDLNGYCFQNALHRLRIKDNNKINAYYFYWVMFLGVKRGMISKHTIAATIAHFTMEKFKKLNICVPPFHLQTQFAHIVSKTEALKSQYQQSLQELENLYGSLSQKAFRGELESSKEVARAE